MPNDESKVEPRLSFPKEFAAKVERIYSRKPEPMTAERLAEITRWHAGRRAFAGAPYVGEMIREITRLQAVASHAETESQAYAELATEQKGEIERLKSGKEEVERLYVQASEQLDIVMGLCEVQAISLASLKQLLADCPAKEIATMAEHTTMPDIAHMAFGIKMRSWLDARAKAIGEAGG